MSWDPVWEQVHREQEWGKYPPEHVIRFVARNWYGAPRREDVRLLDVGCGGGAVTWYVAREGFTVSGIDGSPAAVEKTRKRLADENLTADVRAGDFVTLPWNDSTFDGAIDNASIYSNRFELARRAVEEVHRVLKPGALFLSATFTSGMWGAGAGDEIEPGGFAGIREGPLRGKGFSLLLDRQQLDDLYAPFEDVSVEMLTWTAEQMTRKIEMWITTCRKQA